MQPGDAIGQYELLRKLGAGAFGEVWLARHLDLGVERALKIPTDPDYLRQLRQEARIQCAIRHPRIVETIELNIRHATPHFVMEYVDGESLRQRLNRDRKLPASQTVRIIWQILDALKAAHAQGILHRDLKPENILLTRDGAVKVTDFGLGKVQAQITQSLILSGSMMSSSGQSISGTFEYMSPEQRAGKEATPRDDICSVGIMACELLTGRRPPPTGVGKAMQRAGVPDALAAVVDRACDEFDYRFASVDEMQSALLALAKAKASASSPKPTEPATPAPLNAPPPLPDAIAREEARLASEGVSVREFDRLEERFARIEPDDGQFLIDHCRAAEQTAMELDEVRRRALEATQLIDHVTEDRARRRDAGRRTVVAGAIVAAAGVVAGMPIALALPALGVSLGVVALAVAAWFVLAGRKCAAAAESLGHDDLAHARLELGQMEARREQFAADQRQREARLGELAARFGYEQPDVLVEDYASLDDLRRMCGDLIVLRRQEEG